MNDANSVSLNRNIYSLQSVNTAIKAFDKIADIHVYITEKYYQCLFLSCKNDNSMTMKEFENYCIDLENQNRNFE